MFIRFVEYIGYVMKGNRLGKLLLFETKIKNLYKSVLNKRKGKITQIKVCS